MQFDELSEPRAHKAMPMAPRLRSPSPLEEPPQKIGGAQRRVSRGVVLFVLFQLIVAVGVFVVTRDYMSGGALVHSVRNILLPGDGSDGDQELIATPKDANPENTIAETKSVIEYQKPEKRKAVEEEFAEVPAPVVQSPSEPEMPTPLPEVVDAPPPPVEVVPADETSVAEVPLPPPIEPTPLPEVDAVETPLPAPVEPPPMPKAVVAEVPPLPPPVVEPAAAPVRELATASPPAEPIDLNLVPDITAPPLPPVVEPAGDQIGVPDISQLKPVVPKPAPKIIVIASAEIAVPAPMTHGVAVARPKPAEKPPEVQAPVVADEAPSEVQAPVIENESAPIVTAETPAAKPPLTQSEGEVFQDCDVCPKLVAVTSGRFMMGDGDEGDGQEDLTPPREVTLNEDFAVSQHEVTFEDWDHCVADGGCSNEPSDEGWGRGKRPVINVSYNEIVEQYLPWLSRVSGQTYRLPTEPEWEFAARGGKLAVTGQAYSFGNDVQIICQYGNSADLSEAVDTACDDGFAKTAPVGSFKPNLLGLFDMHGNVWEWVGDCWRPSYSADGVAEAGSCKFRVLRGGSWSSKAAALRTAGRGWEKPEKVRNSIGFRVARSNP